MDFDEDEFNEDDFWWKKISMIYSAYFEKASEVADTNPQLAASLLREAVSHALQVIPKHFILCARGWEYDLHDHDNAIHCLL